jgi:hypothetical protein
MPVPAKISAAVWSTSLALMTCPTAAKIAVAMDSAVAGSSSAGPKCAWVRAGGC